MVRVAGLREQAFGDGAPQDYSPDGLRALTQLQTHRQADAGAGGRAVSLLERRVVPQLAEQGIRILAPRRARRPSSSESLDTFFRERAFPILTPMAIDPSHPSPRFHNRGLYLAAMLRAAARAGPEAAVRRRAGAAGVAAVGAGRARATSSSSSCWKSRRRPAAGAVRRLRRAVTGRRSASRATGTSNCSSKSPTTCCG